MKLTTRGRFGAAVLSWISALALLTFAPETLAQNWPTARAGADFTVLDTDGVPGEIVTLNGTASTDPDGDITSYEWSINDRALGQGPILQVRLQDGSLPVQLNVYDSTGRGSFDTVIVTVIAPNRPPTANAGGDRTVNDSDGTAGENVLLDGRASSDPENAIASYQWYRIVGHLQESLGSGSTLQSRLPDGVNSILLVVTDNAGNTNSSGALITINPPAPVPPIADAGPDQNVVDSNRVPGETVTLDGHLSRDPDGSIASYAWYRLNSGSPQLLGTSQILQTSLPDGANTIQLTVTDNSGQTASDTVMITVSAPAPIAPIANAGGDRTVLDSDRAEGETVRLDGSASRDPDGEIVNYAWARDNGEGWQTLGSGITLQTQLPDGTNTIQLTVTDNSGSTATDTVTITVTAPPPPDPLTANAGADRTVNDTDNVAGENVLLDGSGSTIPEGSTVHYYWSLLVDGSRRALGDSNAPTLNAPLPDGENVVELLITGSSEDSSTDTVVITVAAPTTSGLPTANAGADRTVNDTDRTAGENVTLDGSASSDPGGEIVTYTWTRVTADATENLGGGATLQVRLPDGVNTIRLTVTDNSGNSASDTVVITVGAAPVSSAPTANAGADRTIEDTDQGQGEDVVLDGSWSVDPDGTLVDFAWSRVDGETVTALGNGLSPTLRTRLPDGDSVIQLVVTDNSGATASDTVLITVNAGKPIVTMLGDLPGLTPNQKNVADALDRICAQLRDRSTGEGPQLSGDQQDLLARCDGLQMNNTTANQVAALDELVADDFAVARTQTLLFANTMYAGVMDRLMALRGGAKGLSLAGLNIMVDGSPVPLAQLQDMVKGLFGGGASADEPGGLLNDKWGLWARGNYSTGEKDRNTKSPGFDADQWAMVGGVDYRYNDQIVGGVSLAYGQSSIDIDAGGGGLETDTYAVSLYGSSYVAKQYYVDAIINVANADYGADRNIAYADGVGLVDLDARGETSGMTYSAGISGGRDFLYGGFTLSPTLGFFYIDATIDSFTERGAGGLNLIYDEQSFQSFTGNLGFRVTYAWNTAMGVLMPHLRVDYVREFKDDVDVFGVRFAADPGAASTPPILVATDNPDESYWRLATGLSAQFIHGISGYVEYQRLESFEFISFQDLSLGLRFQKSF